MTARRLPLVAADSDDPAVATVFDVFRDRGREPPVLYRTLANAPAMLGAWTGLAWPLRHAAMTPRGLRELVIMRVGQLTRTAGEWLAHWPMAVQHGVGEERLAALDSWATSDLFSPAERAVLAFTDEVTVDLEVSEDTYATLTEHFDAPAIVELVLTAAFYSCVSRVLRAFDLQPEDPDDPRLAYLRPSKEEV